MANPSRAGGASPELRAQEADGHDRARRDGFAQGGCALALGTPSRPGTSGLGGRPENLVLLPAQPAARAADYAQTIIRTCEDETACDALVRLGGNTQAKPALFAVAIKVLEYRLRHTPERGVRVQDHTSAPRLARLLGSPHADEGSRKMVVSFILEMLPVSSLISVVSPIMHLVPGLFRSKLMALAHRSDEWFSARLQFPELGAPCAGQLQQFRHGRTASAPT